jgi:tetratricopeptide (TPR) repeat protein
MPKPPPLPRSHRRSKPLWIWALAIGGALTVGWIAAAAFERLGSQLKATEAWNKAVVASDQGDHERALEHLDAAEALGDDRAELTLQRAYEFYHLERFDEALALYKIGLKAKDDDGGDWLFYGHTLYELGQEDAAAEAFKKSVTLDDSCGEAWAWVGFTQYDDENYEDARAALKEALSIDGGSGEAHAWLGYTLCELGESDAALPYLKRAIELGHKEGAARRWLLRLHMNAGRHEEAERVLAAARKDSPGELWVLLRSADLATVREQFGDAEASLREAVAGWPEDYEPWFDLGVFLHGRGEYEEAEDRLRTALELTKEPAIVLLWLGRVLRDSDNVKEAIKLLDKLTVEHPTMVEGWYERGLAHEDAGHWEAAAADFARTLERDEEFSGAAARLQHARDQLKED